MDAPHSTSAYDHLLKILVIGDVNSNKRALLRRYIGEHELSDNTTLGLDYKLKDIVFKGKRIKLQLWDTAGQERFRSVTASYYRGAHGALLAFSLMKETSFVSLNYWLEEIRNNAPQKFQVILVATDVTAEDAEVNMDIARHFAKEKNLQLMECDVGNSQRVETVFLSLVDQIMSSWTGKGVAESVRLDDDDRYEEEQGGCAC